jgi:hypothetical protein
MLLLFYIQVRAQLLDIMKTQRLPLTSCTLLQNCYVTLLYCHFLSCAGACAAAGHYEDAAAAADVVRQRLGRGAQGHLQRLLQQRGKVQGHRGVRQLQDGEDCALWYCLGGAY